MLVKEISGKEKVSGGDGANVLHSLGAHCRHWSPMVVASERDLKMEGAGASASARCRRPRQLQADDRRQCKQTHVE